MSYAIFKGEKSLKDLATRLFALPDKTAKTAKQAQDALLQANPQLKDLASLSPGSVLSIPADAPPLKASETAPAFVSRQAEIASQSQASLYQLDQKLQALNSVAAPAFQGLLAALESDKLQAIAQKSPDLKEQLPAMLKSAEVFGKAIQAQQSTDILAAFRTKPGS